MSQIIRHWKDIVTNVVEACGIILEIVENRHDGTFLVVRKEWLKADILESDGAILTVTPHCEVLYSKLKIKYLQSHYHSDNVKSHYLTRKPS